MRLNVCNRLYDVIRDEIKASLASLGMMGVRPNSHLQPKIPLRSSEQCVLFAAQNVPQAVTCS